MDEPEYVGKMAFLGAPRWKRRAIKLLLETAKGRVLNDRDARAFLEGKHWSDAELKRIKEKINACDGTSGTSIAESEGTRRLPSDDTSSGLEQDGRCISGDGK